MKAAEARRTTSKNYWDPNKCIKLTLEGIYFRIKLAATEGRHSIDYYEDVPLLQEQTAKVVQKLRKDGYEVTEYCKAMDPHGYYTKIAWNRVHSRRHKKD